MLCLYVLNVAPLPPPLVASFKKKKIEKKGLNFEVVKYSVYIYVPDDIQTNIFFEFINV